MYQENDAVELKQGYVDDIRKEIIAFANTNGGTVYIASSAPASDEAIRRMIKETDGDRFEETRSLNQDLTFDEAGRLFKSKGLPFEAVQMKSLGLINEENLYTNLALLLSDQCPHIIKAATFVGNNQDHFQDRKEFTGSLLKQMNDAYSYLELRNQTGSSFSGLFRIDARDYSEKAIREALLNAIEHRDYSYSAPTLISVFADRIEFVSYGGLAGGVQMEDVLNGLSVCRNQKLAGVFYRLDLVEAYGTGLSTIRNAYAEKNGHPEFIAGPSSFRVILPNMNTLEDLQGTTSADTPNGTGTGKEIEEALRFIEERGEVTRSEIAAQFKLSASSAIRLMKKLKDNGFVMSIGNGKNVKYKIVE